MNIRRKLPPFEAELEIWKTVVFDGIEFNDYEVSNLGRVRSIDRVVSVDRKNKTVEYSLKGKVLKENADKDGYYLIHLRKDKKQHTLKMSRVVYSLFVEPLDATKVIHHKNSVVCDNRVLNLMQITHRENSSIEKTIKSGLPVGVSYDKRKKLFNASIRIPPNSKKIFIGTYKNPKIAGEIYQRVLSFLNTGGIPTKENIQTVASDYRETIGLNRIEPRK